MEHNSGLLLLLLLTVLTILLLRVSLVGMRKM